MSRRNLSTIELTRRHFGALGLAALSGLATGLPMAALAQDADEAKLETLRFYHPPQLAFAAPFQMLASSDDLDDYVSAIEVDEWSTPDILRSLLVNDQSDVTAVPSYVGANLYNKGIEIGLAAIMVWGLLWTIAPEGTEHSWESLRGQSIMIPFPNDMPDLVFQRLAVANGLVPGEDFEVEYYAKFPDVAARLASGKGSWAVIPEHMATVALKKAQENGQPVDRFLSLQEEWGIAFDTEPRIPQAGVVVPNWLSQDRPELLGAILDGLTGAVARVNGAEPDVVSELAVQADLPEGIVKDVIPRLNLQLVPAAEAREELEFFYSELAVLSPDIIGGQLPDDGFYLEDPR